jgi:FKBP-type peptidyl-prolyl cis-trans isomerase FklB
MKIKGLIVLTVMFTVLLGSCVNNSIQNAKLETKIDSLSYAFGIVNYNALKQDSLNLNPLMVAKAMLAAKEGKPLMDDNAARGFIMAFVNQRDQSRMQNEAELNKDRYKANIAQGDSFLQKNKEKPGVTVTPSGLQYEVVKMGTGAKPSESSTVRVHYVGTLINGTKFDSSYDRNEPAEFPVKGVIKGWTEALQLMPVGSKFKFYIPESLAYGGNGAGESIKPYSTLIFEVDLIGIVK